MKHITKQITRIDSSRPWHALIDIFPDSVRGCGEVHLIGDPVYYGPEELDRIVSIARRLMRILASGSRHLYDRMIENPEIEDVEAAVLQTIRRDSAEATVWRNCLRQRILISILVRSGEVETELAYANVDPALFSAEDIDWLVAELNLRLQSWFRPGGFFIAGQN